MGGPGRGQDGWDLVDHQVWLQDIPAQMSVRAPLRMVAYSVQTRCHQARTDHDIAGVTVVVTEDFAGRAWRCRH